MSNNLKTMISAIFATTMVMTCANAKADCCQGHRDNKAIVSPDRNRTLFDCEADPCKTPPLKKTCKCKCKGCINRAHEPRLPRPKYPDLKYSDLKPKLERPRFDTLPLKKTCKCKCKGCINRAHEPRSPRPKPMH